MRIKLDETGFSGTVEQAEKDGKRLPDLVAHRPEEWRFKRLAGILEAASGIATNQPHNVDPVAMMDALHTISDFKGDFTCVWRRELHVQAYEYILEAAIEEHGEDDILHELAD